MSGRPEFQNQKTWNQNGKLLKFLTSYSSFSFWGTPFYINQNCNNHSHNGGVNLGHESLYLYSELGQTGTESSEPSMSLCGNHKKISVLNVRKRNPYRCKGSS